MHALYVIVAAVLLVYVWEVWRLYRNYPQIGTRLVDETVVLLAPLEVADGYERVEWTFGSCLLPRGSTVLPEHRISLRHGEIISGTAFRRDLPFLVSVSLSRHPRFGPYMELGKHLRLGRADAFRSTQSTLTTRFGLLGLTLRRLKLQDQRDVRFSRVRCNELLGFASEGRAGSDDPRRPVALRFCTLDLFDERYGYGVHVLSTTLDADEVRAIAASFRPGHGRG